MKNGRSGFSLKGLLPFEKEDADLYYIHEAQTELFFRKLRKNKFVFLTGDSGSGKTSFLNCIVSAQIGHYFTNDSFEWETTTCRPGLDPFKNLAIAIANANINTRRQDSAVTIEALLRSGSNGMLQVFEKYPVEDGKCLLIVIDCLEDIFFLEDFHEYPTQSPGFKMPQDFINLLWTFERQSSFRVYIVTSFSNLFHERIAGYPKLLSLVHRTDFRFEGFRIADIDQVIDKITSPVLDDCADIEQFKKSLIGKFNADVENNTLDPTWRFQLSQTIKLAFGLWSGGYLHIRNKISKNLILKKLAGDKYLPRVVNDLLYHKTLITSSKAGALKGALTKEEQNELTREVQAARELGKGKSIMEWYHTIDKAENSIGEELNQVFASRPDMKKLSEFMVKCFTANGPILRPLRYRTIVQLMQGKNEFNENLLREYVYHLGNGGAGLLMTVPSSRIEEELNTLGDKKYIDADAVIAIRNQHLLFSIAEFKEWIKDEHDCISEYLNYAQMANKRSTIYPIALRVYTDATMGSGKHEDLEQLRVIKDFLQKDRFWATLHTHDQPKFASFEETRSFVARGINYWKGIRKAEEDRAKEDKRLRKIKRNLILLGFAAVALFAVRSMLDIERKVMLKQLDCLHDDRLRILSLIDSQYIANLEDELSQEQDSTDSARISNWVSNLEERASNAEKHVQALHESNILTFAVRIFEWKKVQRELADTTNSVRKSILRQALDSGFFKNDDVKRIEVIEGYKLYNGKKLPNRGLVIMDCSNCEPP